jgi:hypothetical protein
MKDPAPRVRARPSAKDFAIWERELKKRRLRALFHGLTAYAYQGLIAYGAQTFPQSLAYRPSGGRPRGIRGKG